MHDAASGNRPGAAEQHNADRHLAEIDRETAHPALENEQLVQPRLGKADDGRHPIAELDHPADMLQTRREREGGDALPALTEPDVQIVSERGHSLPVMAGLDPAISWRSPGRARG